MIKDNTAKNIMKAYMLLFFILVNVSITLMFSPEALVFVMYILVFILGSSITLFYIEVVD